MKGFATIEHCQVNPGNGGDGGNGLASFFETNIKVAEEELVDLVDHMVQEIFMVVVMIKMMEVMVQEAEMEEKAEMEVMVVEELVDHLLEL